jgi:peptidoglycan/xylan/chitin deacetylase (PgdA/CDA1 family)
VALIGAVIADPGPAPATAAGSPAQPGAPLAAAVAPNQAPTSAVAVVAQAGGHLVAYRGPDGVPYQRTLTGENWSAESSLGGHIVGAPALATAGSGTVVLAARGTDGALWIRLSTNGAWGSWQSLGGVLSAAPAVVGSADGRLDVFVRGTDAVPYTRTFLPGSGWQPWAGLGGHLAAGPAAVAFAPGRIDLYGTGTDQSIWRRSLAGGAWSSWSSIGGRTYTAPAAAALSGNGVQVFVRGTDNRLQVNANTGGGWSGWASLGGTLIDAPAATGDGAGAVDVIVRGSDNALWIRRLRDGQWAPYLRGWAPAGPLPPAESLLGTDWTRIPTTAPVIALTFDAGANAAGLSSILSTLQARNVPATFFLTGNWVRSFPAEANAVTIGGFVLGNHTDTHPHLPAQTDAQVRAQVLDAQRFVLLANGGETRPLFRFPYGDVNARVLADVNGLGYVSVRWTVDSLGWQGTSGGQTAQRVVNRVLAAARPGGIVLMHVGSNPDDGTTLDAAALPQIVDGLRARGYTMVTLAELTG